jgi:hypothetical protein
MWEERLGAVDFAFDGDILVSVLLLLFVVMVFVNWRECCWGDDGSRLLWRNEKYLWEVYRHILAAENREVRS